MISKLRVFCSTTLVCVFAALCSTIARADVVTNISFPYGGGTYNPPGTWATQINGASIVAAPTSGNTGTGITFTDWNGNFNEIDPGVSHTYTFDPIALTSTAEVNSLLSTFYGSTAIEANVTFINSAGSTAVYGLVGDQTLRDYNNNIYTDDLLGYNTASGLGAVSAINWWNNGQGQRLDVQTFLLPSIWAGTDLTSITISDPANSGGVDILSALQVDDVSSSAPTAVTPEPSSLALLSTGLFTIAAFLRRQTQSDVKTQPASLAC